MRRSAAQKRSPDIGTPPATGAWPAEPYLGMNFYTAAEAPLFGERDQEIEQCAALVGEFSTRLLVLQGKSGTGKSSFLRAGLIPKLEQQGSPFYFLRAEKGNAEPTFVRCTDDPVSRIHALLVSALENDPQLGRLPIGFRQAVGELLASAASDDRVDTAAAILKVLAVLSEGLPQTLVLIIDQSEEILTLQTSRDPNNRRKAFFYLLEELCLRSLDVRVIVALRTEFCGRFYDAFGINPSLRVTSDVRAGLEQFMLGALPREGIVAAILRPTLATPIEGYGVPREQYRFKYGEGVAEHIAEDLLSHCGDSSTLPVLQIACKALHNQVVIGKKCPKITIEHYKALGGVKGRVDAYIDDVLRGALQETGATSVSSRRPRSLAPGIGNIGRAARGECRNHPDSRGARHRQRGGPARAPRRHSKDLENTCQAQVAAFEIRHRRYKRGSPSVQPRSRCACCCVTQMGRGAAGP